MLALQLMPDISRWPFAVVRATRALRPPTVVRFRSRRLPTRLCFRLCYFCFGGNLSRAFLTAELIFLSRLGISRMVSLQ